MLRKNKLKTIAIVNNKGGVGKTTSVNNLGHYFAKNGFRTLLIDMDPQGDLSKVNGYHSTKIDYTIDNVFNDKKINPIKLTENLSIIPANARIENLNTSLIFDSFYTTKLREILSLYDNEFDICVIDCSPSLSPLTRVSLCAASSIYIPITIGSFELTGAGVLIDHIKPFQQKFPDIIIKGIFVTQWDNRTGFANDVFEAVNKTFNNLVLKSKIRANIKVREAIAAKENIFDYKLSSHGSIDYKNLGDEIIALEGLI